MKLPFNFEYFVNCFLSLTFLIILPIFSIENTEIIHEKTPFYMNGPKTVLKKQAVLSPFTGNNAMNFERQTNGDTLIAGVDTISIEQPYLDLFGAGVGISLSTDNPVTNPLNLYNSELTGGGDNDLERNSEGTGLWEGGNLTNEVLHNLLIINRDAVITNPNDNATGGQTILTSDTLLTCFGFDFVDLDANRVVGSMIIFENSVTLEIAQISFADLEDGSGSIFEQIGVAFGDRHGNRIENITAEKLGITAFDKITFSTTGSGGIGTIFVAPAAFDYGDLPDLVNGVGSEEYETLAANGGPSHQIIDGLFLGNTVDADTDGSPSTIAAGDDSTGIDDEDGITSFSSLNIHPGGNLKLPLVVTNTTGEIAYVEAWIDWNGDGDFNDLNEMVVNLQDNADGDFPAFFDITVPTDADLDNLLGFRIRLSNEDNMSPNGHAFSGEVEDYIMNIDCLDNICLPITAKKI